MLASVETVVIDRQECLRLLSTGSIGRIAATAGALPVVVPVSYVAMDGVILLRAIASATLSPALDDAVVAFQVDEYDADHHQGWSVMIQGRAHLLKDEDELRVALAQPLAPWGDPDSPFFVAIPCDVVSGERVAAAPPILGAGPGPRLA
jgi:nitroimidazol reductase NimA-like FMN-containing flavoprotein (pyridoxamine 5'-phosphate oxidase superfamily)